MDFAINPLSIVAIRNSPSHKSEMLSQLLFGELAEIIERKGKSWLKVRCQWDDHVGWVAASQLKEISREEFELFKEDFAYNLDLLQPAMSNGYVLPLPLGAKLPAFDGLRFKFEERYFSFSGQAVFPKDIKPTPALIAKIAKRYLHAPYLWGGRSPLGIDSSGLVQMVFNIAGFSLGRRSEEQVENGETVHFAEQSTAGDIAIFENSRGRIMHSGIILPEGQIIHANGKVRIDTLDHFGIFNEETGKYTHRLRLIKRLPLVDAEAQSSKKNAATNNQPQFELF